MRTAASLTVYVSKARNLTTAVSKYAPRGEAYACPVRVHVISDLEGVSGIVKGGQTSGGEPMFEEARRLYTEEINAAVRGAKTAGATEIVVMDCHGAGGEWTGNPAWRRVSRSILRDRVWAG